MEHGLHLLLGHVDAVQDTHQEFRILIEQPRYVARNEVSNGVHSWRARDVVLFAELLDERTVCSG